MADNGKDRKSKTRADQFIDRVMKLVMDEWEKPYYKSLHIFMEFDNRGKLPQVTVRVVPPGVKLKRDERDERKKVEA
jgi:hypothetical protein